MTKDAINSFFESQTLRSQVETKEVEPKEGRIKKEPKSWSD